MLLRTNARTIKQYFLMPTLMLPVFFDFYLMAAAEAGIFYAYSHRLCTHFQHFLFSRGTVRHAEGPIKDSLQQISLSLSVLPVKNINHSGKLQLAASIIAEINRIKTIDFH